LRIACVYSGSIYAAWAVSDAIPLTLKAMGHEVLDLPQGRTNSRPWPSRLAEINACDVLIFSGPEHWFVSEHWFPEMVKKVVKPRLAYYHESQFRPDRNFPFKDMLPLFDHHFYPAIQDAESMSDHAKGRCHFLPFGADTAMFHPIPCKACKGRGTKNGSVLAADGNTVAGALICDTCKGSGIDLSFRGVMFGFIGMLYEKRKAFINRLGEVCTLPPEVSILCGNVGVNDLEGPNYFESAKRLALNYNRILCFVNLPSLSQLAVTKVVETMACGCCVLTPELMGQAKANMKHLKSLYWYKDDPKQLNDLLMEAFRHPEKCVKMGLEAAKEVAAKHSVRQRLEEMLEWLT